MPQKYLFLQCRYLGDAIISTGLINSLGKSFPKIHIDVFTKHPFRAIFENNPYIESVFCADFPIIAPRGLSVKSNLALLKQICELRKQNYNVCLNREGDFRENLIGRLVKPEKNISVVWCGKHVYNKMIRKGLFSLVDDAINIPEQIVNVYNANDYVAKKLGCNHLVPSKIFLNKKLTKKISLSDKNIIAVHPGASGKCRLWSVNKWSKLIRVLISQGFSVWIFCAPSEKVLLQRVFCELIDKKNVVLQATDLDEFFVNLSFAKLLVGLDSFAVHAACALGVPSIMLNGANDYRIFQPPNAKVIAKVNVCTYYPCYNKPKCIGSKFEYICINSIEVNDVIAEIKKAQ